MQQSSASDNLERYSSEVFTLLQLITERLVNLEMQVSRQPAIEESIHGLLERLAAVEMRQKLVADTQELRANSSKAEVLQTSSQQSADSQWPTGDNLKDSHMSTEHRSLGEIETQQLSDIEREDDRYQLQESIWDAVVLIGFSSTGVVNSFLLWLAVVINSCFQLVFCLVVYTNMNEWEIDEETIDAARHWRGTVGHDVRYADADMQISLVARLCSSDAGLQYSASQKTLNEDLMNMLHQTSSAALLQGLNGRVLAMMALIIWFWAIINDVQYNLEFTRSVVFMKWQPREVAGGAKIVREGSRMRIAGADHLQIGIVLFCSTLPRMGIAIFLGYIGIRFLAFTLSLNDLLLNAMALTFILDIDELLFEILVPLAPRKVLSQLDSLALPPYYHSCLRPGHVQVSLRLVATCLICAWMDTVFLEPCQASMIDVTNWLCSGNQNFVVTPNKGNGVLFYTESKPDPDSDTDTYRERAVLSLAFSEDDNMDIGATAESIHLNSWESLYSFYTEDVEWSSTFVHCWNHLPKPQALENYDGGEALFQATRSRLRIWIRNTSLEDCADVNVSLCTEADSNPVRGACPLTCGCSNPWSGLFFSIPQFGCPGACAVEWDSKLRLGDNQPVKFNSYISNSTCSDIPIGILRQTSAWPFYLDGLYSRLRMRNADESISKQMVNALATQGCSGLANGEVFSGDFDPCTIHKLGLGRSVRIWCPAACGCVEEDSDECPCVN